MLVLMGKPIRMNRGSHHRRRGHPRRPPPPAGPRRVPGRRVGLRRHRRAGAAGDGRRGRLFAAARRAPARPICSTRSTACGYVDAVVLTGGSAYGLAAADGVMRWLEEQERGVAMGAGVVPIVPAAVIFDLPVGGWDLPADGRVRLCGLRSRPATDVAVGTVGAGVGARAGVLKGGVGPRRPRCTFAGVTVGAMVVVNCGGQRRRPGHRPAVDGRPDRRVRRCGPPPAEQIAALAAAAVPVQRAEHHDRRGGDRRRAEPGGAVIASRSPPRTVWPAPSGRRTPRWTATPSSRWPPARSRCRPSRYPGRDCRRRPGWSQRWAPPRRTVWRARCWSVCWPPSRSPGYRATARRCPVRSAFH